MSEYLYHNKNEYFDLLQTTQYRDDYIRGIKFLVNAVSQVAKQVAEILMQCEQSVTEDWKCLAQTGGIPRAFSRYLDI